MTFSFRGVLVGGDPRRQTRLHGFLVRGDRYEGYLPVVIGNYVVDVKYVLTLMLIM